MPSVIDSLIVQLSLDAKPFTTGSQQTRVDLKKTSDAAITMAKEMEARGKQAAQIFSAVKVEALGLLGVLLGGKGLETFVKDATTNLAALGREARNIGETVPNLAAFMNMIARQGGNADAAAQSLENLTNTMERVKVYGGTPEFMGGLAAIGGGRNDSAMTIYEKFFEYTRAHLEDIPRVNLIARLLGLDPGTSNATIQMARRGADALQKEMQRSRDAMLPTEEMTGRMAELQADWIGLTQAAEGFGNTMLADVEPQLHSFLTWLTETTEKTPGVTVGMAAIAGWLTVIAGLNFRAVLAFLGGPELAAFMAIIGLSMGMPDPGGFDQGPGPGFANSPLMKWWRGDAAEQPAGGASGGSAPQGSATGRPDQQGSRQQTIDYFIAQGRTPAQAAANADVIGFETGGTYNSGAFNPAGGGQGARGAMQWRGDRIARYRAMYGHDPDAGSYAENLAYIQWEQTNPHSPERLSGELLGATRTEAEGVDVLNRTYTRPGHPYGARRPDPALAIGPRVSRLGAGGAGGHTVNVTGPITVNTRATDAKGIGADIKQGIQDAWIKESNRGLN